MNPSPGGDEEPAVTDSPTLAMPAQPVRPSANSTPSRVNSIQSSASKSSASNNSTTTLQPMTRVASRLQEMRGGSSNGRVHFMEQVHPRKMASTPDLRGARGIRTEKEGVPEMPGVQPKVGVGLGRKASSAEFPAAQYPASSRLKGPGLAKVDMRGRRPAVNGLPTGVRPVRAGRAG